MHREFRPQDMHQLDADPFVAASLEHTDHAARRLYIFTAVLGLLIGGDVILSMSMAGSRNGGCPRASRCR